MNIKSKIATAATALALVASLTIPSSEAQAKKWGMGAGIAAGLIGAAVVGSAIAANAGPVYYDGRRCRFVRQYDQFGYYVGTTKVCNYY